MKTADIEVTYLDHMGSDLKVANAACVSFNKESDWCGELNGIPALWDKDAKLINYLTKHKHFSPFNHCFLSFRVKAPIFVARQLVKHKFMPWNEVSRRYVDDEPEFYVPDFWRKRSESVKQGSSDLVLKPPMKATGKCLYCNAELPDGKYKYCSTSHQASHSQERRPLETKFSRWKATAKQHGVLFTITEDDLDWPKFCAYLDIELDYRPNSMADNVASIDKIVPELGYVPGNVQIISLLANQMKTSATKEQLLLFAKNAALIHGGIFMESADSYEKYLENCANTYGSMIAQGYCAEQARAMLPLSSMTSWMWSGTLGAYCDMLKLRLDPHTQKESRIVAEKVKAIIEPLFPVSVPALLEAK